MGLDTKPASDITIDDLKSLIEGEVREGKTIEYKRELDLATGEAKREFLADVVSFLNTSGGHLLFGIDDDGDLPKTLVGLELDATERDQLNQKIENLLRDGVDPRPVTVEPAFVALEGSRHVLVLRVRKSWLAPHMVKTSWKFYARNSAGKFPLDVDGIRDAFSLGADTTEKVAQWHAQRIGAILADDTPTPLEEGAKLVVHLLPVQAFSGGGLLDLTPVQHMKLIFSGGNHERTTPNFEGVVATLRPGITGHSYAQVFRNGCLEHVEISILDRRHGLRGKIVEDEITIFINKTLPVLKSIGVDHPIYVMISLLHVRGYKMMHHRDPTPYGNQGLRDDVVRLPEILLQGHDDVGRALKPAFDVLWNCYGMRGSPFYDDTGNRLA